MSTTLCVKCSAGPSGEAGHDALAHHLEGPYPGHHIFMCADCGERWIRHYGSTVEPFAWTRYNHQFPMRTPRSAPAANWKIQY